ncbi:hypothetical protein [Nonomuraea aridisoli]|uniref:Copper chaperone PCu(A)C n=1 Tax=Nonomuraea aridisoli TaxID=2070368 RepID=A0A2W2FA36_9ACTN|nr:hypothetical protein [Nonomuraea aridisoli]PZG18447.1 hypothetical protein C1J01_14995 [Nonomuraea aridisoli]
MRPAIVTAVAIAALAAAGCGNVETEAQHWPPQNEGANAEAGGTVLVRNAFLLGSADPASPAPQLTLFAVIINRGDRADRVERITVEGGGSVQLAGPITLPPNQPVGTGDQPIGTVTGVRGTAVPMTFTFAGGRSARTVVPVMARTREFAQLPTAPAGPPSPTSPATAPPSPTGSPSPAQTLSPAQSPSPAGSPTPTQWPPR